MAEDNKNYADLRHDLLVGIETTARDLRVLADEVARPFGLSNSRWLILCILRDRDRPLSQKELAAEIGIEGPTLVRILDGMERDGWVRRQVSDKDRRVKQVIVEEATWETVDRLSQDFTKLKAHLLDGMDTEALLGTVNLLARLRERVNVMTGRPLSPLPPSPQE